MCVCVCVCGDVVMWCKLVIHSHCLLQTTWLDIQALQNFRLQFLQSPQTSLLNSTPTPLPPLYLHRCTKSPLHTLTPTHTPMVIRTAYPRHVVYVAIQNLSPVIILELTIELLLTDQCFITLNNFNVFCMCEIIDCFVIRSNIKSGKTLT